MLAEFIDAQGLSAKIISCSQPVHTVREASEETGRAPDEIIKSILFIDEKQNAVLAIVLGNSRVSEKKLCIASGAKSLRIAGEKEVWDYTGYVAGGVPPVSIFGVRTIIDSMVAAKETVIGGGGDEFHLLQLPVKELLSSAFEPAVADILE